MPNKIVDIYENNNVKLQLLHAARIILRTRNTEQY